MSSTPDREPAIVDEVLAELVRYQETRSEYGLLQFGSLIGAHQYLRLYRLLLRYVPRGSTVLDWGCGNGHFSYALLRLGYRAVGFSFNEFSFREVLGPLGYEFLKGNPAEPTALPFSDESFDGVVSVGVLEHVRETGGSEAASLREIRRILRPRGHFLCYHLPGRFSIIDCVSSLVPGKGHHRFRHTRGSVRRLCGESGLEPIETRRYGSLPRNICRFLPRRVRNSRPMARAWDALDAFLAAPVSVFCQNHYFVALRGSPGTALTAHEHGR